MALARIEIKSGTRGRRRTRNLKLFEKKPGSAGLVDRGARVTLRGLDQPHSDFASPLDAFSRALQHEQDVTAKINKLYALAVAQSDYPAQVLLQWFITEQIEEEKNATRIVEELKMVGGNTNALLLLNRELGARQPESAQTGESA